MRLTDLFNTDPDADSAVPAAVYRPSTGVFSSFVSSGRLPPSAGRLLVRVRRLLPRIWKNPCEHGC